MGGSKLKLSTIVYIAVAFFTFAVMWPLSMSQIANANITGWNAAVVTMFTVLAPIIGIVAIVLGFLSYTDVI